MSTPTRMLNGASNCDVSENDTYVINDNSYDRNENKVSVNRSNFRLTPKTSNTQSGSAYSDDFQNTTIASAKRPRGYGINKGLSQRKSTTPLNMSIQQTPLRSEESNSSYENLSPLHPTTLL